MSNTQSKKKSKRLSTIFAILIFLLGLGVLFYPVASDLWNQQRQNKLISSYTQTAAQLTQEDFSALWEAAHEYNNNLNPNFRDAFTGRQLPENDPYWGLLNPDGSGVMGYIEIPSIRVNLPIYHGVDDDILQYSAGHLPGSSLPVGGEGTHCVLSGHRGLPSAKLFTNLDRLQEGDTFMLNVLNDTLTYEVDQIRIVLPDELYDLEIEPGQDYCTLVTCTPYGINTHRLLIRGHRIETPADALFVQVSADALQIEPVAIAPLIAVPLLLVLLILLLAGGPKEKKQHSGKKKGGNSGEDSEKMDG